MNIGDLIINFFSFIGIILLFFLAVGAIGLVAYLPFYFQEQRLRKKPKQQYEDELTEITEMFED